MSRPLLAGLDLGTTNAKVAVYDLQGDTLSEASVPYPTSYPQRGWAEQRPVDWTTALSAAMRQTAAGMGDRLVDLAGIGLSAHGPGLLLVAKDGHLLLKTSPTWQDERCLGQGRYLLETIGSSWPGMGVPTSNFPPKLLWVIENNPREARLARYAMGIKDYLGYWLSGEIATDPSSGPGAEQWFRPVFEACAWPIERLPPIRSPAAILGRLRPSLAQIFGLLSAPPVILGLNDGASASLAAGAIHSGDIVLTLSTNGVARLLLTKPVSPALQVENGFFCWPYIADLWIAGGQTKSGASALSWMAKIFAADNAELNLNGLLLEAAGSPPGSRGLVFFPYLAGRGSPDPDATATAAFLGFTRASVRGDLVRSILEGVAFVLREIIDTLTSPDLAASRVLLTGGGGQSSLWRQIIADVLGQPITYFKSDSTLGAAILTATSLGLFADLDSAIKAMVRPIATTTPNPENRTFYASRYRTYLRLRDRLYSS